jgi:hypothetical protein
VAVDKIIWICLCRCANLLGLCKKVLAKICICAESISLYAKQFLFWAVHCYYTFFDVQVFFCKKIGYSTSLLRKIFAEHCLYDADSPPPAFPGKKTGANKMRGMARNLAQN